MSKVCRICNIDKPLENYRKYITHGKYQYIRSICKSCESKKSVEYAKNNSKAKQTSNKRYFLSPLGKRAVYRGNLLYRKRHPEKYAAHLAVSIAIRNGSMVRKPCKECGNKKSHAHHNDYSKKLKVIWLCSKHHLQIHKMLAQREINPS